MKETIRNIEVSIGGKNYEMTGGGSTPGPNSVGTEEIQDEGVKKQDLDKDLQDKLDVIDESNVVTEEELSEVWADAIRQAHGGGTQEAGAAEYEVSGDSADLDDL